MKRFHSVRFELYYVLFFCYRLCRVHMQTNFTEDFFFKRYRRAFKSIGILI